MASSDDHRVTCSKRATDGQQDRLSQPALTLLWGKISTSKRVLITAKTAQCQVMALLEVPGVLRIPAQELLLLRAFPGAYPQWLGRQTCVPQPSGSSLLLSVPFLASTAIPESGKFLNTKITPTEFHERKKKRSLSSPFAESKLLSASRRCFLFAFGQFSRFFFLLLLG